MKVAARLLTIDQGTAQLGIVASSRLHWSLGTMAASEWRRIGNELHFEPRPKTNGNPTVPAPQFKAVYPAEWLLAFIGSNIELAARQLPLFPDD